MIENATTRNTIDSTTYYHLKKIYKEGYTQLHSETMLPTYIRTLEGSGLVKIEYYPEMSKFMEAVKRVVKVFVSKKGLAALADYEQDNQSRLNRYITEQVQLVNNLDIELEQKTRLIQILYSVQQIRTLEDAEKLQKSTQKSIWKNQLGEIGYGLITAVLANVITSFFK